MGQTFAAADYIDLNANKTAVAFGGSMSSGEGRFNLKLGATLDSRRAA